ncbi:hypothetical protein J1N35_000515, partial [Gossypium stocksii]
MRRIPPSNFTRLNLDDFSLLEKQITNEEIKAALFDMAPLKAPVTSPEDFTLYRPISLCSILYKLVMKVIANRFKIIFSKIIGPEQARFIT